MTVTDSFGPLAPTTAGCDYFRMQDCDPAQAAELVRALREQVREMTHRLGGVERRYVPGLDGHPLRLEADALRRDIAEAETHVNRLCRRYLSGDERMQQRPVGVRHGA